MYSRSANQLLSRDRLAAKRLRTTQAKILMMHEVSLDGHPRCAAHAYRAGCGVGQIDTSTFYERTPVRDANRHAAAIGGVGHRSMGAKSLCSVRGGQCVSIETFAGCGAFAVITVANAVLRSGASFGMEYRRRRTAKRGRNNDSFKHCKSLFNSTQKLASAAFCSSAKASARAKDIDVRLRSRR